MTSTRCAGVAHATSLNIDCQPDVNADKSNRNGMIISYQLFAEGIDLGDGQDEGVGARWWFRGGWGRYVEEKCDFVPDGGCDGSCIGHFVSVRKRRKVFIEGVEGGSYVCCLEEAV